MAAAGVRCEDLYTMSASGPLPLVTVKQAAAILSGWQAVFVCNALTDD